MGLLTIRSETLIHKVVLHQEAEGKVLKSKPAFAEHSILWSAQS